MSFLFTRHMKVIGWLTLLLCFWSTGDLVVDLVFEEPDVTADASVPAEEPGNAAEHLLMPSQRAVHSVADVFAAAPAAAMTLLSTTVTVPDHTSLRVSSSDHQPPPTGPLSPLLSLRI
jgi:hypothetical protein